jgi:hypothetical protein
MDKNMQYKLKMGIFCGENKRKNREIKKNKAIKQTHKIIVKVQ